MTVGINNMKNLVLKLSPTQAAQYIKSYSYDILRGNTSDSLIIDNVRAFIASIKDSQTVIDILYCLLTDYANELMKLSGEDKNSSLYYNLSDFTEFHYIFSSLNEKYNDEYNLSKTLTTLSDMAHVKQHKTVINWLEFYNV